MSITIKNNGSQCGREDIGFAQHYRPKPLWVDNARQGRNHLRYFQRKLGRVVQKKIP